jgi:hypothetical protein
MWNKDDSLSGGNKKTHKKWVSPMLKQSGNLERVVTIATWKDAVYPYLTRFIGMTGVSYRFSTLVGHIRYTLTGISSKEAVIFGGFPRL